jgi:hypothetical protein
LSAKFDAATGRPPCVRIDVLLENGQTQEIGAGGYGSTEQP